MIQFRLARREDVPEVVALLADDMLGRDREIAGLPSYLAAFDAMQDEGSNHLIVGEDDDLIVACYQLTFISGLSLSAARRAQIEAVRVAASCRGRKIGEAMIDDAGRRARDAGCTLLQFTTNKDRNDAHRFYDRMGFTASHIGYKKPL
ncbi:GNAT family N-acetyltransferase [Paracoccus onubensis]|uniref:GNAT family N-acetyltransferase n=1 Tax=Paracoccus onubensis TaxID=1675788 RepID=A0A418SV45_9RHOB|nr:GNAT family N-acetyltransferase [Paracoccus onubensis]RJE84824.1 GNAT family N-acetyltransferase [Paracoccus onubensis]